MPNEEKKGVLGTMKKPNRVEWNGILALETEMGNFPVQRLRKAEEWYVASTMKKMQETN